LNVEKVRKEKKYMPSPVASAIAAGLGDWVDAAQSQFVSLLPVALGLVVTIAVTFMAIRYFRGIVKI
jgi:hypothetical protein